MCSLIERLIGVTFKKKEWKKGRKKNGKEKQGSRSAKEGGA